MGKKQLKYIIISVSMPSLDLKKKKESEKYLYAHEFAEKVFLDGKEKNHGGIQMPDFYL